MNEQKLFTKNFILVVIGQIISLFGNSILRFALPLYLLRTTGSATLFGIVTACSFLPMIFLSLIGGVLADRFNKRNIMVILDFITALVVIFLLLALNKLSIVPLFIIVLMILYGISGTYQPTVQASIPSLVSSEKILSAGAIINQIGALSNLLGPIIGGMLFGTFGIIPILIISILCFTLSAIMEIFIHIPYKKRNDNENMITIVRNDLSESINYMKSEKPILIKIIVLIALFNLVLTSMMIVGMPVLIIDILNLSDSLLGISQGILALGGLCGGILTAILGGKLTLKNSHLLLLFSSIFIGIMAIPLLLQASSTISYIVITGACFFIMTLATIFSIQMIATVQTETPPHLVGKVIACMMSFSMCAQPIGQSIYGLLFDKCQNNIGFILLGSAIISVLISLASKNIFKNIKVEHISTNITQ
ncbi:MAG: MFS transporter [Clostridium sp.]